MTVHADIVGEPSGKFGRVDDASIRFPVERRGLLTLFDVEGAGTVTIFAADRQFQKRRVLEPGLARFDELRPAAVTHDAARSDGPVETEVPPVIAGRKAPRLAI